MKILKTYTGFWWGLAALCLGAGCLFIYLNDDLQPAHITSGLPYQTRWALSSPLNAEEQKKLNAALNQPFYYLSEGGQSHVFSSKDQRYVLKIFKFKRFRPSILVQFLPTHFFQSYRQRHTIKREEKRLIAFKSHQLAYEKHREASGLIFVQLNPSEHEQLVSLTDKWGFKRDINLKQASYIVQEKGEILSVVLSRLIEQGKIVKAKACIKQLFHLYLSEYKKGIYDLDHGVMHNIGCIEERLIHLDVGKMVEDEQIKHPAFYQEDLNKIALKIKTWLHAHYPDYEKEFVNEMEKELSALYGNPFYFPSF